MFTKLGCTIFSKNLISLKTTGPQVPGPGDPPSLHYLSAHDLLEEARHTLIIIEHDPLLYKGAIGMVEYVSQGLHDAAKKGCSPALITWNRYFPEGSDKKCLLSGQRAYR